MNKKIKSILLSSITIILSLVLIINVYTFVSVKILKEDYANVFGYALLEVVSGSMEPTIKIGDLIVIDTNEKNYKKDDIVTFRDVNGSFVTHRIIVIDKNQIVTKGDANNSKDDGAIDRSKIVGKYKFRIKNLGILIKAFKTPFVMIMIFIIGILSCILISTDKLGNPIYTEDEKEMEEFRKYKKEKLKKEKNKGEKKTTKKK